MVVAEIGGERQIRGIVRKQNAWALTLTLVSEGKVLEMIPSFLVHAVGWMTMPFTNMGKPEEDQAWRKVEFM